MTFIRLHQKLHNLNCILGLTADVGNSTAIDETKSEAKSGGGNTNK